MIDALIAHGSPGIEETGVDIVGHVPAASSIDGLRSAILAADPAASVSIAPGIARDWSEWKANVRAHKVGSLTVAPPWLAAASDRATTVVIDPAMAFGTGEHATTRGVIHLMPSVVTADSLVADLGAGSAILSIAAAKLGAKRVVAIELDPDAESNALANIRRNGVEDRVHFIGGDALTLLPLVAPVDLVLANILSSVIVELLPIIRDSLAPEGRAILSGVLIEEQPSMVGEIARGGWAVEAEHTEEGWWSALIARP
ncbi:MAG TPA: 50S ribosomal protein L11 methyltransferase [Gemmatimonadaceae bacterium]|nr:50S ribosomal protein L11 methyltransferase [Gemmatimonadaceae bacterium]